MWPCFVAHVGRGGQGASIAWLVVCLAVVGCSSSPMADEWVEARPLAEAAQTWKPPRDLTSAEDATLPRVEDITQQVTLPQAITLALLHNPQLAVYAWDVRAAEARQIQAGLLPNPQLMYGLENFAGPDNMGDMFVMQSLRLSQVIELGGKRAGRVALAQADQRLAAWDYEAQRLEVVTQVTRRYVELVAAQQGLQLARQSLELSRSTWDIANQRAEAGVVPGAERDRASVRVSMERIALDRAEKQLAAARQALASMWAGQADDFERVADALDETYEIPPQNDLRKRLETHPRLARWDDEIHQRQQAIALAKANVIPNVMVGGGVRHFPDADETAGVVEVGVDLPIFDRNQGNVLESRYRLGAARAQRTAAEAVMHEELAAAYADFSAAAFAIRTLQDETLPAARSAFDASRQAFESGRTDYINVLDAERTLIEVQQQYIDARARYYASAAVLEGLTGTPLQPVENGQPDDNAQRKPTAHNLRYMSQLNSD